MDDSTPDLTPPVRLSTIYALLDADGNVRYVGITAFSITDRLMRHLKEAARGKKTHKCNWLRSLSSPPTIVPIEQTYDRDREIYWIAHYRSLGVNLTNETDGGQGRIGACPSEETRAKIGALTRGRFADPEYRARCGASLSASYGNGRVHHNSGKQLAESIRVKIRLGLRKHYSDPANRAKISAAITQVYASGFISWMTGRTHSEETRAKLRAANLGKTLSSETIKKMQATCQVKRANGYVSPLIGRKASAETCAKISAANKGKVIGPEYRAKLSAAAKGKVISADTREKLSVAQKRNFENGRVNPFSGKKHTEETKVKLREARARLKANGWVNPKAGRTSSEETRAKIKASWVIRKQKQAQKNSEVQKTFGF